MLDFLTFKTFITPTLLIFSYYLGAIFIPLLSWHIARFIKDTYFPHISKHINQTIHQQSSSKQRILMILFFMLCFFCMEVFWRILFEFFIAYFDMHDALLQLTNN